MDTRSKDILIMLCFSLGLCACSTTKLARTSIPEQGLTVSQLYHQEKPEPLPGKILNKRKPHNKTRQFKALANPEVPIYVFAHVANIGDEQIIKPAYTTRFFLYKHNQYALASEQY